MLAKILYKIALTAPMLICATFPEASLANTCSESQVQFHPSVSESQGCAEFPFRGISTLTLCENNRGLLVGENMKQAPIFFSADRWVARSDSYNFSDGISTSEMLTFDPKSKSFFWSHNAVNTENRKVIRSLECSGSLTVDQ